MLHILELGIHHHSQDFDFGLRSDSLPLIRNGSESSLSRFPSEVDDCRLFCLNVVPLISFSHSLAFQLIATKLSEVALCHGSGNPDGEGIHKRYRAPP